MEIFALRCALNHVLNPDALTDVLVYDALEQWWLTYGPWARTIPPTNFDCPLRMIEMQFILRLLIFKKKEKEAKKIKKITCSPKNNSPKTIQQLTSPQKKKKKNKLLNVANKVEIILSNVWSYSQNCISYCKLWNKVRQYNHYLFNTKITSQNAVLKDVKGLALRSLPWL